LVTISESLVVPNALGVLNIASLVESKLGSQLIYFCGPHKIVATTIV
jgi:hypothetical protein